MKKYAYLYLFENPLLQNWEVDIENVIQLP